MSSRRGSATRCMPWRMIVRTTLQLAIGMGLGLAGAVAVSRLMAVILFDVRPHDPLGFGGVAGTLVLAGILASAIPALRATRVDPLSAPRAE